VTSHLGIDLGVTNIKWAVVEHDAEGWRTAVRDQVATLADEGADGVLARMIELASAACADREIRSIGVGVPGLYDPATGATRDLINMPGRWKGQPVRGQIEGTLGLPARLINDARAFGLAELRLGAGRGAVSMIGLTLGTGIGGVVVVDGRVIQGHDGTAGELGHQTIDPDGPPCSCGNHGCLESLAKADRVAALCGTDTAEAAVAAARAGDARALEGLAEVGRYLGIGIANMVVALTPDRVVLGGGISAAGELLLTPIAAELRRRVHVTSLDEVELRIAELGTWAGAIGAALHGAQASGT
jgi:glucokinase